MRPTELTPPFGARAPRGWGRAMVALSRRMGSSWPGVRMTMLLRRLAIPALGPSVDTEVFGCRVRLHPSGNICEKRALFAPSTFDAAERASLAATGAPEAVFLDVGANVGLYALSIARAWSRHPGTRILAFEPHPTTFARLAFNVAQNPDLPIEALQLAITASPGAVRIATGASNLGQSRISEGGEIEVPGLPLLDALRARDIRRVDALKVDVEGHEEQVLGPFLSDAPDSLIPRLMVLEDNRVRWNTDLVALSRARGLGIRHATRMNLIFERTP